MSVWTLRATIGGTTYTQQRVENPDPDADPALPALVAVKWLHELEDGDGWPRARALTTAQVQLLVDEAADAADITPETVVHLELLTDELATTVVDSWSGRGSFPTIEPTELGCLVTISVTSYLLDLDGYMTGGAAMPAEEADARMARELGLGIGGEWAELAARPADPISLLELARDTFSYGAAQTELNPALPNKWRLFDFLPQTDAAGQLDPVTPWGIEQLDVRVFSPAPLTLRENPDAPGTYELWADPEGTAAAYVIDGANTTMEAVWSRKVGGVRINTVHLVMADDTYVTASNAEPGDVIVAYTIETQLADAGEALEIATQLLPPTDALVDSGWEAESFTVVLDYAPDGWYVQPLREVMALGGIQRRHHPEGVTYWVGVVTSTELVASGGSASVTVQLEGRAVEGPGAPDSITINDVPQTINSVKPAIDRFIHARP